MVSLSFGLRLLVMTAMSSWLVAAAPLAPSITTECVLYVKDTLFLSGRSEESWSCEFSEKDLHHYLLLLDDEQEDENTNLMDTMLDIEGIPFDEMEALGAISGETILKLPTTTILLNNDSSSSIDVVQVIATDADDDDIDNDINGSSVLVEGSINKNNEVQQQQRRPNRKKKKKKIQRLKLRVNNTNRNKKNTNRSGLTIESLSIKDVRHAQHYRRRKGKDPRHHNPRNLIASNPDRPYQTLVVRITDAVGNGVTATTDELYTTIFGNDDASSSNSLTQQYAACSANQLILEPAAVVEVGGETTYGVVDVRINITAAGNSRLDVANLANKQAQELYSNGAKLSKGGFDLVMFCLPPNTNESWIAYAYVNRFTSYYNNHWCSAVSALMHESGHNFNLAHSGLREKDGSDDPYGDKTVRSCYCSPFFFSCLY